MPSRSHTGAWGEWGPEGRLLGRSLLRVVFQVTFTATLDGVIDGGEVEMDLEPCAIFSWEDPGQGWHGSCMYCLEMSGRRALCMSLVGAHCLPCLSGLGSASPLLLAVLVSYTDGLSGALASGVVVYFALCCYRQHLA